MLIVTNKRWKHLRASKGHECAHYGDGVYGTIKAPHEFGSKYAVIVNNYTNKADPARQKHDSESWLKKGRADFCIPIKVSPSIAYNVMERAPPEIPKPGLRRDGKAIRPDETYGSSEPAALQEKLKTLGKTRTHFFGVFVHATSAFAWTLLTC